tara:strand:- start:325 stop:948 length:624 start_codon:yes stop_codon:yes gene_type:complete
MKIQFALLVFALLILGFEKTAVSVQERLDVKDYKLTGRCEDIVEDSKLKSFEISSDDAAMPTIISRDPDAKIEIHQIHFKPYFDGMLFTRGDESVLHCAHFKTHIDLILLERSERWMIFESGARQATEAHFHSFVGCGTSCYYGRSETIVFFDEPVVSAEEEGWLHSRPAGPIYIHNGDAFPNEYPSRWFLSYLTKDERAIFGYASE